MDWDLFKQHRSNLFHFTREVNLPFLRKHRAMYPAAEIVRRSAVYAPGELAEPNRFLQDARERERTLRLGPDNAERVTLNDQKPISDGQIGNFFEEGWDRSRYTALLNEHVFFYGGREHWPQGDACSSFAKKYSTFVLIRCPIAAFRAANPNAQWLLTSHNTGGGQARGRVRRGPSLFIPFDKFSETISDIEEIAFRGAVALPIETESKSAEAKEWRRLLK